MSLHPSTFLPQGPAEVGRPAQLLQSAVWGLLVLWLGPWAFICQKQEASSSDIWEDGVT